MSNERSRSLCRLLGIEHPLIQAPMAGLCPPKLVAEVSNAGALGSLGVAYLPAEQIHALAAEVKSLTKRPFAINLFAPSPPPPPADPAPMLAALAPVHAELGLPPPNIGWKPPEFEAQVEAVIEAAPAVFSFTLGIPRPDLLERIRRAGARLVGTATSVDEARQLEAAGVDAICAQGSEAGGHRGTFIGPAEDALIGTMALVPLIVDAVRVPVIAAGGIMDGRGISAALELGAAGAQLGTAFLACPECSAPASHKAALKTGTSTVTRAFSGKLARGIRNEFIERFDGHPALLPFPVQHAATGALRKAAAQRDDPRFLSLWAGQGAPLARAMPAAELVRTLIREMETS